MAKKTSGSYLIGQVSPFYRAVFHVSSRATGLPGKRAKTYGTMIDDGGKSAGFVMARHKCNMVDNPYCIPNEFIAARLGTALGLPLPPFALTKVSDVGRRLLFSNLDFNPGGMRLPRIDPEICMENQRLVPICVGIVVFDIWIANDDRHDKNLAVDRQGRPTLIRVFDHDHSLFGGPCSNDRGIKRLDDLRDRLGITGSTTTGGTEHIFLDHINTDLYLRDWVERVQSLPSWIIREPCRAMHFRGGLSAKEVKAVIDFLRHRQDELPKLVFGTLCADRKIDVAPNQRKLPFPEMKS